MCPSQAWTKCEPWLEESTHHLLDILAERDVSATFFVLGCVAEEMPDLVREIEGRGHEIACHSYCHRRVSRQTPAEFSADLRRSAEQIGRASNAPVIGYRAPAFSIGLPQSWAFDVLADNGFVYDSSILPVRTPLYGTGHAPRFSHRVGGNRLLEIPLATVEIGSCRFPVAGGVYLRLLPLSITFWAIRRLNQVEGRPAVLYLHPWEMDPRSPLLGRNSFVRWSHTVNKGTMESRIRQLLKNFLFRAHSGRL